MREREEMTTDGSIIFKAIYNTELYNLICTYT